MLGVRFRVSGDPMAGSVLALDGVLDSAGAARLLARLDAIDAHPHSLDVGRLSHADAAAVAALGAWFAQRQPVVRVRSDREAVRAAFRNHAAFRPEAAVAA